MELGVKYGFIKQTKHRPQIGSSPIIRNSHRQLFQRSRRRQVWYKLPICIAKDIGSWSLDGGMGYTVNPQDDYKNFLCLGGFLVKLV